MRQIKLFYLDLKLEFNGLSSQVKLFDLNLKGTLKKVHTFDQIAHLFEATCVRLFYSDLQPELNAVRIRTKCLNPA